MNNRNLPPDGPRHLPVPNDRRHGDRRAPTPHRPELLLTTTANNGGRDDPPGIDLIAWWRVLVRRRWMILAIIAAVVLVALVRTLLTPAMYRATATLRITPYGMQVMQVRGMTQSPRYDPDFARTQYQLLQSRSLSTRVAENLHLVGSDIFSRVRPPSWTTQLRSLWAPPTPKSGTRGVVTGPIPNNNQSGQSPSPEEAEAQLRAASGLIRGGLSIEPVRSTHLVRIHYVSTLPEFAARVANAVADGYIAASMDRQVGATSYASTYLKDQLAQLRSRLEESERKLVEFAQREEIVPTENGNSLVAQNLADLNAALAEAQATRIRAQARWQEASTAKGSALPADMLDNPVLRNLQTQLADLQSRYQDQLKTFKPEYPAMLAIKSQIDAVRQNINEELGNIRASVKANFDAAKTREEMLVSKLADLRSQALMVDGRSIQYKILKRDVDTNRELYNGLLQRYKQVTMASGVRPSNIDIVDHAVVPGGPFSPNLSRNISMALLLGGFVGIGLALVLEYLDNTINTPHDIEEHLHIGVLGIIPRLKKESPEDALRDPRSNFAESYRSVRTALQFSTDQGVPRSLLVTSTDAGEGKSTSARILAENFAQLGKRVLLVEADLRNPTLAKLFSVPSHRGLSSLLSGAYNLAEVTHATETRNLDVIVAGPVPPTPSELLSGARLVSLLTVAGHKYDQIILDGPPVLGIADAPILANAAEGTLLVIQAGNTRIDAAEAAVKRILMARGRIIGGLLTMYDAQASGYGYGNYAPYAYGAKPRLRLAS